MRFTAFLTKQYLFSILTIVVLLVLILPYPTEEIPEWKLLVIDENYLPGARKRVIQTLDNPYYGTHTVYSAQTDKNGFVTFPIRLRWASISRRAVATGATFFDYDTATGVEISVGEQGCSGRVVTWRTGTGKAFPDKLVCP